MDRGDIGSTRSAMPKSRVTSTATAPLIVASCRAVPMIDRSASCSRRGIGSTDEIVNSGCPDLAFLWAVSAARCCCLRPSARSRGQGGAPGWTNDLDRGEDRGSVGGGGRG